jgi:hypothetical protein
MESRDACSKPIPSKNTEEKPGRNLFSSISRIDQQVSDSYFKVDFLNRKAITPASKNASAFAYLAELFRQLVLDFLDAPLDVSIWHEQRLARLIL